MDMTDEIKLKGGKHQLKCSDQSLWASALIPTEPGHRNIELNLSSKWLEWLANRSMVGRPHCATIFWKTTAFRVQSQGSSRWVRPSAILFWSRETHVGSRVMSCSIVSDIIWVQCHSIASVLPWPITLTTLELSVKIWTDLCLLMSKRDYFNLMWRGASMLPNFAFLSFLIQFNIWSAVARNDQLGCKQSILQWGDTKCMYLMSSVWNTWTQVLEV